ncbi:PAS domain-containing protein [Campylobacter volucris]|uniref:helix-turn-helix transcriptional regulator n=1 Tax=Campylobacter volucris TaxID=1031542 RepID=UPI0018A060BE|nr:PAS domain-containing protein [Campylobacter volucris]MBF7049394.1 PAS domain-containing protein [Campylobacter volucris]MBF7059415.1 PAS domain-containing protein [Campylobacter volucris]
MDELQKELFIKLTQFLGQVLGDKYEIVFHVISEEGSYIAAIANNHISGRTINSPLTSFASELIQEKEYLTKDFLCDYKAKVGNSKIVTGSTFFIKNQNKIVGILCINHDTTELRTAISKIIELEKINDFSDLLNINNQNNTNLQNMSNIETLSHSIEDILAEHINLDYLNSGYNLSIEQKDDIIKNLHSKGIFNIKGSISIVAKFLNMSEPSVYRYLQKLKKII